MTQPLSRFLNGNETVCIQLSRDAAIAYLQARLRYATAQKIKAERDRAEAICALRALEAEMARRDVNTILHLFHRRSLDPTP